MKLHRSLIVALVATALCVGGCEKKEEGPAERAGKELDKTMSETGKAIQDFGKKVEDSVKPGETPKP